MKPHSRIHLIGICGTAMASLAGLLRERGHQVSGSDAAAYPPMSELLRELRVPVLQPFAEKNLEPRPDLVVVGNAISRGNVELEYVLEHRLPLVSMSQLLHDEFLAERIPLVVAGTHGKTTTSSMLAWIFATAAPTHPKFAPSFLIGGVVENFATSFRWQPSSSQQESPGYFVIEGDEYDTAFFDKGPKFLHYFPQSMVLTSVEFDHADIYKDLDEVKTAFKRLVNLVPRNGLIVAHDAGRNVTDCVARAFSRVERYGFLDSSDWQLKSQSHSEEGMRWQIHRKGERWADVEMPLAGEHNALNATAAAALASDCGIPKEAIVQALASFKSVKRRLEVKAVIDGIAIIDDFAHHPTAIRETLRALRQRYPAGRLWAVLEPRSNTLRRNVFAAELVDSLATADRVVLADVYHADALPSGERLHPEKVVQELNLRGIPAQLCATADAIVEAITPELRNGDVVAILSNGGFGNIYETLPARLRSRG